MLGLHARLNAVQPDTLDTALNGQKTLVEVLAMRVSPHIVPRDDAALFTLGALPQDEASLMAAFNTFAVALRRDGITAADTLAQAVKAAHVELADGPLSRGALSAGMTRRLPDALTLFCRPCNARHVHEMLFRLVGTAGGYAITRHGKASAYVRADQWLGGPLSGEPTALRVVLLRQYLRCFGPSTPNDFASWVGVHASEAARAWDTLASDLVGVDAAGRRAWLHADDLPALESAPAPVGVRLLPPYDAYLDQRDRLTLVPDKALHRRIWAVIGNAGALLVDGEVAGVWRPQKKGKRLTIAVEAFGPLSPAARDEITVEAELIGPLRGCTSVDVSYTD